MNGSDRDVAALAAEQFGVFARKQAAAVGLSEEAMSRRVMSGRWEVVFPGVYRLPGTTAHRSTARDGGGALGR